VYRATAYWNGSSAQCCEGTAYKTGTDDAGNGTYGCCHGTKAPKEERTHGVVSVLGAPNGEEACCGYYEEESENGTEKKLGTAYWNGSSVQCCNGIAYQPKGVQVAEYDCCTQETVPSVIQGVPETEEIKQICCKEGEVAYWDGEKAGCCDGELGGRYDNQGYICCPVIDSCPDGETEVDDYKELGVCKTCCPSGMEGAVDGECCGGSYEDENFGCRNNDDYGYKGEVAVCTRVLVPNYVGDKQMGKVCCSRCSDAHCNWRDEEIWSDKNYVLAGAVDGVCCGGYTSSDYWLKEDHTQPTVNSYSIVQNGSYYCAHSGSSLWIYEVSGEEAFIRNDYYVSSTEYCDVHVSYDGGYRKGTACVRVSEGVGDPKTAKDPEAIVTFKGDTCSPETEDYPPRGGALPAKEGSCTGSLGRDTNLLWDRLKECLGRCVDW
ncbi:MAG: hypothetical protein IJC30_03100, partial [Alphaproteobacteria bacterium]|nr:hypothetical protein [Alphaproteobacteria bacterium]